MKKNKTKVGIDAGGSLIKVAYEETKQTEINYDFFTINETERLLQLLRKFDAVDICLTGGKAESIQHELHMNAQHVLEFQATCAGVQQLLQQEKEDITSPFLLINIGTGTSIHYVHQDTYERVAGSGVGGGTLMGLAYLTTKKTSFEEIINTSRNGNRDRVDLKVKDIYTHSEPPIPGDLTASNLGDMMKITSENYHPADVLLSIQGMIGEIMVTIGAQLASQMKVDHIVYIGSTLYKNDVLKEIIEYYTKMLSFTPVFLDRGHYSGALGALHLLHGES